MEFRVPVGGLTGDVSGCSSCGRLRRLVLLRLGRGNRLILATRRHKGHS